MTNVPASAEELRVVILARYSDLSKRMQQIGRHILDHPNDFALETLAVIAERSGVQPSAIVRFAQAFGYEGASQMQRLFRDGLISNNAALGYADRVRQLGRAADDEAVEADDLLAEFVEGNVLALNNLLQTTEVADLKAAVDAIADAGAVGVVGFRRSFPVASYLAYSLLQAEKRAFFIDGVGGLARQQLQAIGAGDLLVAVSFHPYSEETVSIVNEAAERGCRILAISDSLVSPIATPADHVLLVRESEVRKFRSLSASMCLAQALVINYAFEASRRSEAS
ncbi:MAG: MurR/RpiR family transcriptional regulator [Sphingopyxis sp.]|nr:MurR/RpiR family transcriptional regulator [Sphingopyxis sp.]